MPEYIAISPSLTSILDLNSNSRDMITRLFDSQNKMCNLFNYCIMQIYLCMYTYAHRCTSYKHRTYMCTHVRVCMYVCVYPSPFGLSSKTDFRGNHAVVVSFEYVNKSCPGV